MTRQPRLLNSSLAEIRRLNGASLAIDLTTEDIPKATLVLPATEERLAMRDLLELYTPRGSAGIFRVVSLAEDIRDRQTVQLMGAADTLADDVYPQAASEDVSKTASAWITDILSKQTTARWQAGTCALSKTVKIRPNYQNLWSLLETVREAEPGYWWTFDFTTTPWTLSLAALPTATACGVRLSRNIESMSISATDQEMCNRLIVSYTPTSGSQTVTTYNNTASQTAYGIIVKTADIKQEELPAGTTVEQYAQRILAERAQPVVSVSISGVDLYRQTGDDYDKIQLGTLCSAVIEGYGAMTERVVALSWTDALGEPDRVRFSLSNALSPFTENMSILKATAKGLAGMGAAAKEDLDKWSKVVTDRLEAVDGTGVTQMWQSGIEMDAHTGVRIYSLEQGITSLYGGIEVASDHITSTVRATGLVWDEDTQQYVLDPNAAQDSLYSLTSSVKQTADAVTTEVTTARGGKPSLTGRLTVMSDAITAEVSRAQGAEGSLSSSLSLKADSASLSTVMDSNGQVTAASIATAIDATSGTSKVTLSADHIALNGSTTIGGFLDVTGSVLTVGGGYSSGSVVAAGRFEGGSIETDTIDAESIAVGSISGVDHLYVTGTTSDGPDDLVGAINNVQIVASGTGYKLQYKTMNADDWTDAGTFSRATTLSGAWSGGVYTVSASPQGDTNSIGFGTSYGAHDVDCEIVTNGNASKSSIASAVDIPIALRSLNSGHTAPTSRYTKTLTASVASLLQTKTVTPTTSAQTITPDSGKIGFFSVTVNAASTSFDPSKLEYSMCGSATDFNAVPVRKIGSVTCYIWIKYDGGSWQYSGVSKTLTAPSVFHAEMIDADNVRVTYQNVNSGTSTASFPV